MQVKRRTSLLPISTLIRIKKKTKLHTEELQQMYERFCKQYPGGTANLDQFKDVYETFYPGSRVTEFSQLIFQNIDADSNGNVTFEEYLCAFVMINRGSPEQKINWIFNLYDANNDGLISSEEFLHLLQSACCYVLVDSIRAAKVMMENSENPADSYERECISSGVSCMR
ncbi:unnamed protein product [Dibothriocephalus latus]|uniref:EF-hand domain-containing protein n=1 Tax=Dibothriocephalus latus TaxID=60516 RepID=A0A3P7LU89_DIBLA|nr:unnamed protein product [Dibothriocephalus latus]